ncbi:hypothetical protein B0H19DRAFT_240970 [Mycena capillaripes]|nr:hypothetical protein B0H19DRAFT_240970 [Mycena capillaripes]
MREAGRLLLPSRWPIQQRELRKQRRQQLGQWKQQPIFLFLLRFLLLLHFLLLLLQALESLGRHQDHEPQVQQRYRADHPRPRREGEIELPEPSCCDAQPPLSLYFFSMHIVGGWIIFFWDWTGLDRTAESALYLARYCRTDIRDVLSSLFNERRGRTSNVNSVP